VVVSLEGDVLRPVLESLLFLTARKYFPACDVEGDRCRNVKAETMAGWTRWKKSKDSPPANTAIRLESMSMPYSVRNKRWEGCEALGLGGLWPLSTRSVEANLTSDWVLQRVHSTQAGPTDNEGL
jgi:hypothetical protein